METNINTLSILIPSIPERKENLFRLQKELYKQAFAIHNTFPIIGCIEILVDDSKSFLNGGLKVGKKREGLIRRAQGRYVCFLDDDDIPAPNYVKTLLELCAEGNHVVTFMALFKLNDYWGMVNMSLKNKENEQATPDKIIRRPPWHICPVWTEFARLYDFKDVNNAEDFEWMEKVLSHCATESHTDKILFQYNHNSNSEVDKIENLNK
jgi:hypothetical protein